MMKIDALLKGLVGLVLLLAVVGLLSLTGLAQDAKGKADEKSDDFCTGWNSGERNNYNEVRDANIAATGSLTVDAGTNGGVSVIGEERSDVLVRSCVQTHGKSDEDARTLAKSVTVNTGGVISASGDSGNDRWYSVSFHIYAPRNTNLKITTTNGGIKITGVNSTMEFAALNGGIKLDDVSGSIKGRTTNGGIKVDLNGRSWSGTGLDVQTTNGGVKVTMPENYGAHIETGTVNGGFKSNIAGLTVPEDRANRWGVPKAVRINTDVNGGGPTIRAITTNGGVIISTSKED
jgi:hypothetical protein